MNTERLRRCLCGHQEEGHGAADGISLCWNCRGGSCKKFDSALSPDRLFSEAEKAMLVFSLEVAQDRVYDSPDQYSQEDQDALAALKNWLGIPVV